jgi:hypothetical protein
MKKTDWVTWALQAVVGLLVGLVVGVVVAHPRTGPWLRPGCLAQFVWGVGLAVAGLASIYGDQMWIGFDYRIFPPERVSSGKGGKLMSVVGLIVGITLSGLAIVRNWTT